MPNARPTAQERQCDLSSFPFVGSPLGSGCTPPPVSTLCGARTPPRPISLNFSGIHSRRHSLARWTALTASVHVSHRAAIAPGLANHHCLARPPPFPRVGSVAVAVMRDSLLGFKPIGLRLGVWYRTRTVQLSILVSIQMMIDYPLYIPELRKNRRE